MHSKRKTVAFTGNVLLYQWKSLQQQHEGEKVDVETSCKIIWMPFFFFSKETTIRAGERETEPTGCREKKQPSLRFVWLFGLRRSSPDFFSPPACTLVGVCTCIFNPTLLDLKES